MIDQKDPKSVGYTHARLLQTVVKKLIEQNRFKQVTIRNTCSWLHHSCHHLTLLALRFHLPTCGHHDSLSLAKPIAVPSTPQISCSDLLACGRTSRKSKWIVSDTLPDTNTHRTFRHKERVLICTNAFWLQYICIFPHQKMQVHEDAESPLSTHAHSFAPRGAHDCHTHTHLRAFYTQIDDDGDDDDDDDDQWWSMMINDDQWWSMMINDDDHDDVNGGDDPNLKSSLDTNTSSCTQIRHGWWKCKLQGPSWCISLKCEPFFFTCLHQFESTYSKECGTVWNS